VGEATHATVATFRMDNAANQAAVVELVDIRLLEVEAGVA
jgi:hypothetical protein